MALRKACVYPIPFTDTHEHINMPKHTVYQFHFFLFFLNSFHRKIPLSVSIVHKKVHMKLKLQVLL